MPQSLSAVHVHLVFSTKDRRPWFRDTDWRSRLHAHLGEVSDRLDCAPVRIGGTEDHVHILARLGRTRSQADWVKELKRVSNGWIKANEVANADFAWQAGYGAFSVSRSNLERVIRYIDRQEEHHRKMSFQDEMRELLRRHNLEWDEKYAWD